MLHDLRNILFLLFAIGLMLGMVLYATGEVDILFQDNPFAEKPEKTGDTLSGDSAQ